MAVPPRKSEPRRALTENEILDVALALLDTGGPEAATIRRIAAAVGAAPSTVYTYFPKQAAVSYALVDRLLGEVGPAIATTGPATWQQDVEALATGLRARLGAHPGALPLLLSVPLTGPNALELSERLLDLMAGAGLKDEDAARGSHLIKMYVLGAVVLDTGPEEFRWGLRRVLVGLSAPELN